MLDDAEEVEVDVYLTVVDGGLGVAAHSDGTVTAYCLLAVLVATKGYGCLGVDVFAREAVDAVVIDEGFGHSYDKVGIGHAFERGHVLL